MDFIFELHGIVELHVGVRVDFRKVSLNLAVCFRQFEFVSFWIESAPEQSLVFIVVQVIGQEKTPGFFELRSGFEIGFAGFFVMIKGQSFVNLFFRSFSVNNNSDTVV